MILVIDNYDSFTYNLVQYIGTLNPDISVFRNDKVKIDQIEELSPECIVISPGPGIPEDAGISVDVIKHFGKTIPVMGICLGHQAISVAYGGKVVQASEIIHGKTSVINCLVPSPIFDNLPDSFTATRYHSLVAERASLPDELTVTAETSNGLIMAMEHKSLPVYGLQFHPESIITDHGMKMIQNFLEIKLEKDSP